MTKVEKPMNKTELLASVAEATGLNKKQVSMVMDSLTENISKSLGRAGCGKFILPGLLKIEKKKVPARKAKKNVPNPFKPGEMMDVKAKPASTKIVVRPLKSLKDMA
jgi:nucleoid DNA-binding protein